MQVAASDSSRIETTRVYTIRRGYLERNDAMLQRNLNSVSSPTESFKEDATALHHSDKVAISIWLQCLASGGSVGGRGSVHDRVPL